MLRSFLRLYIRAKAGDNHFNTGNTINVYRIRSSHTSAVQMVMVSTGAPPPPCPAPSSAVPPCPAPPRAAPPPPPRRARVWALAGGAALAAAGGVYLYRRSRRAPPAPEPPGPASQPALASALPGHTQYLLVGGGTAAFSAFRAIRTRHPGAQVLMVSEEREVPYMRPPLSKQVWADPAPAAALQARAYPRADGRRSLLYEPEEYFSGAGVVAARGWRLVRLQPAERRALLQAVHDPRQQAEVRYEECLLATGSEHEPVAALAGARAAVMRVRTAADAAALAARLEAGASVVVVGDGPRAGELARHLPAGTRWCGAGAELAWAPPYLRDELRPASRVVSSSLVAGRAELVLADGARVAADVVVEAGPERARAERDWGVERDPERGGVLVGPELQARAHVYAAGDAASYYSEAADARVRAAGHDHAVVSGRLAGDNMAAALLARLGRPAGEARPYTHAPLAWAELGPRTLMETVGTVEAGLRREAVWAAPGPPAGRGVVFYRAACGRVRGVLLWNVVGGAQVARAVMDLSTEEQADAAELAKLFPLYDDDQDDDQGAGDDQTD